MVMLVGKLIGGHKEINQDLTHSTHGLLGQDMHGALVVILKRETLEIVMDI